VARPIGKHADTGQRRDPRRSRRSDRVLAGEDVPRSRAHYAYVGLELIKVAALLLAGIFLLAGG
jgi:hypothetical protein